MSQEGPPPLVGAERQKMFEFSTSTLLEKALKALPSHFNFEQTFLFLLCIFFWVPECGRVVVWSFVSALNAWVTVIKIGLASHMFLPRTIDDIDFRNSVVMSCKDARLLLSFRWLLRSKYFQWQLLSYLNSFLNYSLFFKEIWYFNI